MASTSKPDAVKADTPVNPLPHQGDHDRVAMLSLHADGTVAQNNPEIIGNKEFALEATKLQFATQAVSAVDTVERALPTGPGSNTVEDEVQDPSIEALKAKHDEAKDAAESAAEKTVNELYKD